jgi:hypothetical protein
MVPDGVNTLDTVTAVELEMVSVGESVLEFDIDTDRESETMRVTEAVGVEDAEGVGGGVTVIVRDSVVVLEAVGVEDAEGVGGGVTVLVFETVSVRDSVTVLEAVSVEDAEGVGGGVTVLVFETVSVRDFVILRVKDIVFERLSECVLVDASASTTARAMIAVTTGTACHRRGSNIPALF